MSLPNFLIIGAPKAGTTSLYHYMGEHPEVFMSPIKETNFFIYDGPDARPDVEYAARSQKEYEELFSGAEKARALGEASPRYFANPRAPERIRALLPGAKLILSLRQPADRAYSGYLMNTRFGIEHRTPEEALVRGTPAVELGFYSSNVERWLSLFAREQIEILLFDDLKRETLGTVQRLYRWLDVDPHFAPETERRHHKGSLPRRRWLHRMLLNRSLRRMGSWPLIRSARGLALRVRDRNMVEPPRFDPELRAKVTAFYRDDVRRTGDLIGRDLSHWLDVA